MADFSFNKLNLKNVDVTTAGNGTLPPGRHICKVSDATLKDTRAGGKMIELQFNEIDGKGGIRNWLNVMVPSSEKATQIGREQLKGLLVWGGHEDPDNIGKHGVGSIKGLVVGVRVVTDTYVKDVLEREGSKVNGFLDPATINPDFKRPMTERDFGPDRDEELDDPIPF